MEQLATIAKRKARMALSQKAEVAAYREELSLSNKAYHKAYYLTHREEILLRLKTYRIAHMGKMRLRDKAYRESHEGGRTRSAWRKVDYLRFRDQYRQRELLAKYGLSIAEYQALLIKQNGVCAICEQPETVRTKKGDIKNLHVDHDHETGLVRGLLCNGCNIGIGALRDDASVVRKAADYLATMRIPRRIEGYGDHITLSF